MKNPAGLCSLLLCLVFAHPPLAAGPPARFSFGGLNLSDDNRLLFRADSGGGQHTIFMSRLTDRALRQLTAFPEQFQVVENGRTLLVWNQFGAARIPSGGGLPQPVPGFPSFAAGTAPVGGRSLQPVSSPDGRWILYVEPSSPAYGSLILLETGKGVKRVISRQVELPGRDFPASWSPDSRLFIYAKGEQLFYYPLSPTASDPVAERYRTIGEGGITAVRWTSQGDFFYFRGNTLYLVRGPELYTRTLYGDFLSIGSVAGRLPMEFDSHFDRFWIAPDSRSILFAKGGRTVFYYPLGGNGGVDSPLPYVMIPGGAANINVLWSAAGLVTIVAPALAENRIMTWRFETASTRTAAFTPLDAPPASQCALSPDGTRALFWGETGLALWDYRNWKPLQTLSAGPVYACVWMGDRELIAGDAGRIDRFTVSGQRRLICLSDADEYGFEEGEGTARLLARQGDQWFASDGAAHWAETGASRFRAASQNSGRYRVFLEKRTTGPYENIPMIRSITTDGNASLLPAVLQPAAYPEERQAAAGGSGMSGGAFIHGRRDGPRQVALCFDLYDDDTGLAQVLNALKRFGLSATFFMNGDFIRGNPAAARAIVEAGHEAASLFYAPVDLADSRYRVTPEFIAQGLARNEDDFTEATGAELSLIWHPPFYRASAEISAAAARAAYFTVGRDVDPMDWISRQEARRLDIAQDSASSMVERIMAAKQPGSVIPIRLGLLAGGRDDYLFLRIEVLLDALVRAGYGISPVSALRD